jgi:hypothetical protein
MSPQSTPTIQSQTNEQQPTKKLSALYIFTLLFAISLAFFINYTSNTTEEQQTSPTANLFGLRRFFSSSTSPVAKEISKSASASSREIGDKMGRTPIYFLSHGGVSDAPILAFISCPFRTPFSSRQVQRSF